MLRSRLPSQLQLLALPQLLGGLAPSSSACLAQAGAVGGAAAATAVVTTAGAAQQQQQHPLLRCYAAEAEPQEGVSEVARAAHELGLDAVPLEELKGMVNPSRVNTWPSRGDEYVVSPAPPNQRRLTYPDLPGYKAVIDELLMSPEVYGQHTPKAPVLDTSQWLEAHFKEAGFSYEPRGPFYVWRAWAAAHLPKEQLETLLCVHEVMGDESTRSAFVKQSQHELARLWDWQHRRAELGLPPDLPPAAAVTAAEAAAGAGSSSIGNSAASILDATAPEASVLEAAAAVDVEVEELQQQQETAAAAAAAAADEAAAAEQASSSSSSVDNLEWDPLAAAPEYAEKDVLDVLAEDEERARAAREQQQAAAAAVALLDIPDVVDTPPSSSSSSRRGRGGVRGADARSLQKALSDVQYMLRQGEVTQDKGQRLSQRDVMLRVYNPVAHDGDIFLPTKPLGNPQVAAALAAGQPVNPDKVKAQGQWTVAAAQRASAAAAAGGAPGLTLTTTSSSSSSGVGGGAMPATWLSMPLLDRTVLHEEDARIAEERAAAKPKRALPWQVLEDGYSFDLQQRPPTPTLDLLTSYLEVKYADVLLQRDAAHTLNRQLALQTLRQGGQGLASEVLEAPPAALTGGKTLSPGEREGLTKTLDALLEGKQYGQYREAVLQLYCDGFVSWGELQECWAAAQAGEELAAAEEGPVSIAGDRQQLFKLLSGQQQLPNKALSLTSSSASSSEEEAASTAAARKAWEQAGQKLQAAWSSSSSSSSSAVAAGLDAQEGGISYEEAEQTWQQLLLLAGQPDGPRFDQVLLAGSSGSDGVQQQLAQLQQALQQRIGLGQEQVQQLVGVGSSSGSVRPEELQGLQDVFGAPPTLEQLLQQRWAQVAQQELGQDLSPEELAWPKMWQLLQQVAAQQQRSAPAPAPAADDATAQLDRHLREAQGVPLTPPPYPGARRLLRWEQRLMLHAASGQVVMPAELKVKLAVSAAELQQETGLSDKGLQYLLAVAGDRYDAKSGDLTIACDRFPTREENRRWCLEVLHRLLQTAQGRHPSAEFWLDSSVVGVPPGNPVPAAAGSHV